MANQGQAVRFRDCSCPGTPHNGRDGADDGDIVYLREHLGFAAGAEALRMMAETGGDVKLFSELVGPVYLREGPLGWNLTDDDGPVPFTREAFDALPFAQLWAVADQASDLYTVEVMSPLVARTNELSGNGLTAKPTPRKPRSSAIHRSPQGSSSGNGTAGKPSVASR